jgi:predicted lipoprotein with Yx(FWY)xxD motif
MPRVTAVSAKMSRLSEGSANLVKRIGVRVLLTATLAATLAGCGSSGSTSTKSTSTAVTTTTSAPATKSISLSVRSLPTVGAVLVDAEGRTLYIFEPDKHSKVTCVSSCASLWPPLKLSSGQSVVGPIQLKASLLGSDPDPEGGRVVTYAGWPLYTYAADTAAGQDTGQGIETDGGLWYVISPSGTVITTKP